MKYFQRTNTDCLRCCIATLLQIPYEDVPDLVDEPQWIIQLHKWAENRGYDLSIQEDGNFLPEYSIAVGPSPRIQGKDHAVIINNKMKTVHDPALAGGDIESINYVIVLTKTPYHSEYNKKSVVCGWPRLKYESKCLRAKGHSGDHAPIGL